MHVKSLHSFHHVGRKPFGAVETYCSRHMHWHCDGMWSSFQHTSDNALSGGRPSLALCLPCAQYTTYTSHKSSVCFAVGTLPLTCHHTSGIVATEALHLIQGNCFGAASPDGSKSSLCNVASGSSYKVCSKSEKKQATLHILQGDNQKHVIPCAAFVSKRGPRLVAGM